MNIDIVDWVWSAMTDGELYSPKDIANVSGLARDEVERILAFLARYGFLGEVTQRELFFRKCQRFPAPGVALRILQELVVNPS